MYWYCNLTGSTVASVLYVPTSLYLFPVLVSFPNHISHSALPHYCTISLPHSSPLCCPTALSLCLLEQMFPSCFDGAKFVVQKGLSNNFQTMHSLVLGSSVQPASWQYGATYVGTTKIGENEVRRGGGYDRALACEINSVILCGKATLKWLEQCSRHHTS